MFTFSQRAHLTLVSCVVIPSALAQTAPVAAPDLAADQLRRQQQREEVQRKQDDARPDVRLQAPPAAPADGYPPNESPCFVIRSVELGGDAAATFQWAVKAAQPALNRCLGSTGINTLVSAIQNALIARGYVTARVLAPSQDLLTGVLRLTLVPGRVRAVRFTQGQPTGGYANALPLRPGDLLDLRAIEQGLENLKRVPRTEADIKIVPGEQPGESDLAIDWQGGRNYRFALSLDDSGSRSTGTYQGGATLSVDNPTGHHDLFYVTLNRNVPGDSPGGDYGTRGYALHYSIPYGYWLASFQLNDYGYHQTVAGANQDYIYRGTSTNTELKLARIVYRDAVRKTTVSLRAYQRRSRNFIDDTEVEVQRRRMGGFALALAHKEFIGKSTVEGSITYKLGTPAFGTLPAPEEPYGEGTSRPRIVNVDLNVTVPLPANLTYQGAWRGQWNGTALIPQDRFAIGGRYTVRGFDGEASLSAERGTLLRNDLTWTMPGTNQQFYVALDHGTVSGASAPRLLGTSLTGMALGWRGQLGRFQAEVFAGKPVRKPAAFRTAGVATGFNLNFEY